jgi:hypothetical protein
MATLGEPEETIANTADVPVVSRAVDVEEPLIGAIKLLTFAEAEDPAPEKAAVTGTSAGLVTVIPKVAFVFPE